MSDSAVAELALFVRDAVALVVPGSVDAPPVLVGPVAERRDVLSGEDRADAAAQWVGWWRRIVAVEFGVKRSLEAPQARARTPDVPADLRAVGDPPEFSALADVPQLRAAVRATFDDAVRWQRHRRTVRYEAASLGAVIRQAVDDAAFDQKVPVDTLNGALLVLPVAGPWWRRIAPGQVLCSAAAVSSPQSAYKVVYEAFASSVDT